MSVVVELVIEDTGFGLRAAVCEAGRLVEIREEDIEQSAVTDRLFAARVTAVDAGLDAAFLDCGLDRPGFLAAKDARAAAGVAERRPIGQLVREGDRLIVQGLREAAGDKGARFTTDIRLFGFALVHAPRARALPDRPLRREALALKERTAALFGDRPLSLRRHAVDLPEAALHAEAHSLEQRWQDLQAQAGRRVGPLPARDTPLERLLRGLIELGPDAATVADGPLALELARLQAAHPTLPRFRVERVPADRSPFAETGAAAELEAALGREVPLAGGGRLLIEPTAALVAIDVDGGGASALATDLAAAAEIGRQVRLRNLGGTIVVDFVDLPRKGERQRVEDALRKAFRRDPLPVQVHPMSPLGLVELSRPRRGAPLAARLKSRCASCAGSGNGPAPRARAEALVAEVRAARAPRLHVRAASDLATFLAGTGASGWHAVTTRHGAVELVIDATMPAGSYRLEERP